MSNASSNSVFAGMHLHEDDLTDVADLAFEIGRSTGIREALSMSPAAQLMVLKRLSEADGYTR